MKFNDKDYNYFKFKVNDYIYLIPSIIYRVEELIKVTEGAYLYKIFDTRDEECSIHDIKIIHENFKLVKFKNTKLAKKLYPNYREENGWLIRNTL